MYQMSQMGTHKYRYPKDLSSKVVSNVYRNKNVNNKIFLDKECPLYSQAMSVVMANNSQTPSAPDTMTLVQQMREDGLALKK